MTRLRIAFVLSDLSLVNGAGGGANVLLEQTSGLRACGHDVVLVTLGPPQTPGTGWHPRLGDVPVVSVADAEGERFDVAFATWWATFFDLSRIDARIYAYFNQSLESRFSDDPAWKAANRATYALPLLFVTEASWIAAFIRALHPSAPVWLVRNGLSREFFPRVDAVPDRAGPLRVLVEGPWGVPFKAVPETFQILDAAAPRLGIEVGWLTGNSTGQRPVVGGRPVPVHEQLPISRVREVYRSHDVLVKLSRVEGMYGPPLEMFSQGGTAVTSIVTGCEDLVVHGHNGLLVPARDARGLVGHLEALQRSAGLLAQLRRNALATAHAWPGWEEVTGDLSQRLVGLGGWSNHELRPALAALAVQEHERRARAAADGGGRLGRLRRGVRAALGRRGA